MMVLECAFKVKPNIHVLKQDRVRRAKCQARRRSYMSRDKEKNKATISLAITGSGGAGVMTAGNLLLEVAAQAGWYGLMVRSSGPQIRGGEAAALLRFSHAPIECLDDRFDVLIGLDWQNIHRFADEIPLDAASVMIGDPDQSEPPEVFVKRGARYAPLPFKQMAKAIPGSWPNMIALGLAAGLCGLPVDSVKTILQKSEEHTSELQSRQYLVCRL